jgi:hypothetical protein
MEDWKMFHVKEIAPVEITWKKTEVARYGSIYRTYHASRHESRPLLTSDLDKKKTEDTIIII